MPQGEGTYGKQVGRPPKEESPNKIKNVGYDYKPFQMKAKAYGNSPIEKNYGSPAQRGFDFTGGVGSTEKEGGVGSSLLMASPAKGWFKKLAKKLNPVTHIKNLVKGVKSGNLKSVLSGGVLGGGGDDQDPAAAAAAGAEGGAVAPHSHNPGDGSIEAPGDGGGGKMGGAWGGVGATVEAPQQDLMEGGVSGDDRQKNPFGGAFL